MYNKLIEMQKIVQGEITKKIILKTFIKEHGNAQ
jgi:hypothetical protein